VTAAHLDYEALADFAEGILDDAKATTAEEHLADCDDCRRRAAEVAEVTRVLAGAPSPPMPAHLVDRLDAALAAEAAAHAPVHRRSRRFQFLAAAAAAAVVVGGGAAAVRTLMNDGDSKTGNATQPPIIDRTHSSPPGPAIANAAPFAHTGTRYTSAGLDRQVAAALSKAGTGGRHAMTADDTLSGCVKRVSGAKIPLLVDSATFDGQPATIIALPGADAAHANVWVVGSKCSLSDTDLLTYRQIAR
jgi:hypothetical protein